MWKVMLDRLEHLRSLDRQFQVFGAAAHRYRFGRCVSEQKLLGVEERFGTPLPANLRDFYATVGDGGAGPDYGLLPHHAIGGLQVTEPYPGVEAIKAAATADGFSPRADGYFEASREAITGLFGIIHEGCGHVTCLIASGAKAGNVVCVSCDGFVVETNKTLVDLYGDWLEREISSFEAIRAMMQAGKSYDEICAEVAAKFGTHDAGDRIASIANVPKPAKLFGWPGHEIHHGAVQFPWYKKVLADWQERIA